MTVKISWALASATLLLLFVRYLVRYLHVRAFMARTGCLPPPTIEGGILGSKIAKETTAALEQGQYLAVLRGRFAKMGNTYQGNLLGLPYVATIEPENLKAIFTRIEDFTKLGRKTDWWPLLQGGILIADGTEWKKSRALLQPTFAKAQLANFTKLETHIEKLVSQIPKDGGTVELQQLFCILTLRSGLDYLLGHNDDSEFEQKEQALLSENLQLGLFEAGRRSKIGIFRLLDPIIRPRSFLKYLATCKDLHRYFDRIIDQRLTEMKDVPEPGSEEKSTSNEETTSNSKQTYVLLDHLAQATQDRVQLRWELSAAMSGSRDTTAGLLVHIFWEMARRPNIWSRLQRDVDALGGKTPDAETLGELVYLKAIINESLRMYPNIGTTFRWVTHERDTVLPVGGGPDGRSPAFVPAGRRILTSFNALHRRRDIWGEDADEFRPERWIIGADADAKDGDNNSNSGSAKVPKPLRIRSVPAWTYLPFGGGPRVCPGQHFALVSAQYTIVRLMQTFRRIEARDQRPYAEEAGIPIMMKHGVLVGLFVE